MPLHHEIICFQPQVSLADSFLYGTSNVLKINTTCADAYLAVQIPNNDFAPLYCQDDILLLTQRFPQEGEIAIFLYQSQVYLSKFHHAYNNDYILCPICGQGGTLHFKRMDSCHLIGTCIGIAREAPSL